MSDKSVLEHLRATGDSERNPRRHPRDQSQARRTGRGVRYAVRMLTAASPRGLPQRSQA